MKQTTKIQERQDNIKTQTQQPSHLANQQTSKLANQVAKACVYSRSRSESNKIRSFVLPGRPKVDDSHGDLVFFTSWRGKSGRRSQ